MASGRNKKFLILIWKGKIKGKTWHFLFYYLLGGFLTSRVWFPACLQWTITTYSRTITLVLFLHHNMFIFTKPKRSNKKPKWKHQEGDFHFFFPLVNQSEVLRQTFFPAKSTMPFFLLSYVSCLTEFVKFNPSFNHYCPYFKGSLYLFEKLPVISL